MLLKALLLSLIILPFFQASAASVTDIRIDREKDSILKSFVFIDEQIPAEKTELNTLIKESVSSSRHAQYVKYQQYHQNIRVMGRSVVKHIPLDPKATEEIFYTGKLTKGLAVNINDYFLTDAYRDRLLRYAIEKYSEEADLNENNIFSDENSLPVIWVNDDNKAVLAYKISFKTRTEGSLEAWPHYLIDAASQDVIVQWNNIQTVDVEQGDGGNHKTGKYRFGQAGMPAMPVTKLGNQCFLANGNLRVVSLKNGWFLANPVNPVPMSYPCQQSSADYSNGAWSPANDAFVFGHLIVEMYKKWYGQPVLKRANGTKKSLTVLVHAGKNYENAYWDGSHFVFGDGFNSYHPMVSLGVTAHELTHAFTSIHSGLFYFNQSGAINEAFSDMSAIAAEYYFMKNYPQGYQLVYGKGTIDWLIGDRIAKGNYAMRSMSRPHAFGSADCLSDGAGCHKTWGDIVRLSQQLPFDKRQGYIVHKGSGIFNRAFFNMVNAFDGDVKKVFGMMLKANMTRWSASSGFSEAACGVMQVARNMGYDEQKVHDAFMAVNITPDC